MLQILRVSARVEALRRKICRMPRYPVFLLFAAACVLIFFFRSFCPSLELFLRDFGARDRSGAKPFSGCRRASSAKGRNRGDHHVCWRECFWPLASGNCGSESFPDWFACPSFAPSQPFTEPPCSAATSIPSHSCSAATTTLGILADILGRTGIAPFGTK